ncbi:MAG TPA: serine hydrolase domain-containing protein [Pyrinomonadaceae bacterium]|nr:serine hydrolase domain-containing protein [Pyrinomonadaceae bacterium]
MGSTTNPQQYAIPEIVEPDEQNLPIDPRVNKIVAPYYHQLGGYLTREIRRILPGAAVMVRNNDEVVHVGCYGYANVETEQKITPDTIFDLGSLSKQFTAFAALWLFNENEIQMPLSDFFSGFPRYADEISVRDLIHHLSGLPDYMALHGASRRVKPDWYEAALRKSDSWYPQMEARRRREFTNKDVVRWIASQKLLPRKAGSEFEYSNSGYVLLAELIERKTGERLADVLKKLIFEPLGMQDTYLFDESRSFPKDARELVNHARCYSRVRDRGFVPVGYTRLNFIYGDGNVHSTIMDLMKWELALHRLDYRTMCSDPGVEDDDLKKVRDLMWTPIKTGNKVVNYSAGWNLMFERRKLREPGRKVARRFESSAEFHRGEWLAWRSYIARATRGVVRRDNTIDPKTWASLGIIVLTNNKSFNACAVLQKISHVYWGNLKKDNIMAHFNCS